MLVFKRLFVEWWMARIVPLLNFESLVFFNLIWPFKHLMTVEGNCCIRHQSSILTADPVTVSVFAMFKVSWDFKKKTSLNGIPKLSLHFTEVLQESCWQLLISIENEVTS